MGMLPIFIGGFITGIWASAIYISYKKETPSEVKVSTLEHYINSLKEDITLLEDENKKLREELKNKK